MKEDGKRKEMSLEVGKNQTCRAGCIDLIFIPKCSEKQSSHLNQGTDMI